MQELFGGDGDGGEGGEVGGGEEEVEVGHFLFS
jgi:hypothetical protein